MTGPIEAIKKLPAVSVIARKETGRFLLVSALVGVGVGLGAVALVLLLEAIADLTSGLRIHDGSVWILLTVPAGFLTAWWLARSFAPEIAGDGVPEAAAALAVTGGHIRKRVFPLKIIATALTVGSGGSAGREGPIVHIGGSVGSVISRWFRLGEDQVRSLVAAGAGAGVGAAFNAPIAGMLFALEVILGSFATRHMSAIVIASVTAAVTSRTLVGEELAIQAGRYQLGNFMELFAYAAMALAIVVIGVMFLRMLDAIESVAAERNARLGFLRPLGAGLLVAGLIMIEPRLFGTGQEVTNALLNSERLSAVTGEGEIFWWVLILLALGKAVATSLTISSGASGGAFMPSLFMGAAVGTAFARIFEPVFAFELEPGAFAVVGMAAMFAVVARAPLTAILIVFEITGARDYGLILPLMLTAVLGTFLADRLSPDSVYTLALKRKGIRIRATGDVDLLDTIAVNRVMRLPGYVARPEESLDTATANLARHRSHGTAVVGDSGLVGIITVTDINRSEEDHATVTVEEVMTPRPVTVVPSTPVSQALERMAVLGVGRLPVVDEHDPTRLVGLFRREDAVRAYHEALGSSTDAGLERARLAQRVDPGAGYYDFRIPPGSMADGRKVGEVSWPEGSTLVSVRRNRQVIVPDGSTILHSGDVVTAFGTGSSKQAMIDRLNSGADEPTAEIPIVEIESASPSLHDELGTDPVSEERGSDG
ncbi:MAG: chloride channel protein [Acidimicrobiia bacterium]